MSSKKRRIAAADIGSNNLHLKIADVDEGELSVVARHVVPTRLSQDVDEDGRVSPGKMTQIVAVLNLFKAIAEGYNTDKFLCVATEATRSANNGQQFIDFVRDRTGLDVEVISEEMEAALTFRGATYNTKLHLGQLVVDIGGGSTELIVAHRHQVDWMMTVPIGSGRLTDRFIESDPPTREEMKKLRRYLDRVFEQVQPGHRIDHVIFTGGTAQNLHLIAACDQAQWKLKRRELREAIRRLQEHRAAEISATYQLDLARAITLPAGAVVAHSILVRFNLHELRISPQGVRSGLILTYAQYGDEWNKHLLSPDIVRAPSPLDRSGEI